jgi:hypothetical protein
VCLKNLSDFSALLDQADGAINQTRFGNGEVYARQRKIFENTKAFVDRVNVQQDYSESDIDGFSKNMTALIMENTYNAAKIHIENMVGVLEFWKNSVLNETEWKSIKACDFSESLGT